MSKETKILWLSRHKMTKAQAEALKNKFGSVHITQASADIPNVHVPLVASGIEEGDSSVSADVEIEEGVGLPPLKQFAAEFNVFCCVLPTHLLEQCTCLVISPVIAESSRETLPDGSTVFHFVKWSKVKEVKIVKEDL